MARTMFPSGVEGPASTTAGPVEPTVVSRSARKRPTKKTRASPGGTRFEVVGVSAKLAPSLKRTATGKGTRARDEGAGAGLGLGAWVGGPGAGAGFLAVLHDVRVVSAPSA